MLRSVLLLVPSAAAGRMMRVASIRTAAKGRKGTPGRMPMLQSSFLAEVMTVVGLFIVAVIVTAFVVTVISVDSCSISRTGGKGTVVFVEATSLVPFFAASAALATAATTAAAAVASNVSLVESVAVAIAAADA
jgi:hypothetical protein